MVAFCRVKTRRSWEIDRHLLPMYRSLTTRIYLYRWRFIALESESAYLVCFSTKERCNALRTTLSVFSQ